MDSVKNKKVERVSFSKIPSLVEMPDFLALQKESFERFLQLNVPEDERDHVGLEGYSAMYFPLKIHTEIIYWIIIIIF